MPQVNRKVTYRLYPTTRQEKRLLELLVLHQRLYNVALEQRILVYRSWKRSLSFADQCKELTELRAAFEEYKNLNAQSEQVTLKRVDLAFRYFFGRVDKKDGKAGFPRFKSLERFPGFGYKTHGDGWRLLAGEGMKHGRLNLTGVGSIQLRGKARTQGEPKTLELLHKDGLWYASVTINCRPIREKGQQKAGDENAAKVILMWALKQSSSGWEPSVCGVGAIALAAKHETLSIPA